MPEADQDGLQLLGVLFDHHWKNQQLYIVGIVLCYQKTLYNVWLFSFTCLQLLGIFV